MLSQVTTDPESNNVKNENPGIVASDSLAGESIKDGGSFAENSSSRGPMEQPARSLNSNTTDTSNATTLEATADRASRGDDEPSSDAFLSGAGNASGRGNSSSGFDGSSAIDDVTRPKGANLTEGGFDSGAPNASFTAEIGSKNDPGREGLKKAEASDFPASGGVGGGDTTISGDNSFDALGGSTSA